MKGTVLILNENQDMLESLSGGLRREQCEVVASRSVLDALGVLGRRAVDVVVADQKMKTVRGAAFLKLVGDLYPETIRFMLTGKSTFDAEAGDGSDKFGDGRHFFRPCNPIDLTAFVLLGLSNEGRAQCH